MTDQQILDNARVAATHIDNCGRYYKLTNTHRGYMLLNNDGDWDYCNPCTDLRSLSDIRKITELEKQLAEGEALVIELAAALEINQLRNE